MSLSFEVALLFIAIIAGLLFIWYCRAYARKRAVALKLTDPKTTIDVESDVTRTTAQVVGAAALTIAFVYNLTKDSQTLEQTQAQAAATTFSDGVKLFNEKADLMARTSGIYLLERVAVSRPEYREPLANTLVAFIRNATPAAKPEKAKRVDVDIRAAVQVLGRTTIIPEYEITTLNLDGVNLAGADLSFLAGFAGRRFDGADLRAANFIGADVHGAFVSGADMNDSGAYGPGFNEDIPKQPEWSYQKYWYAVQFDCADLSGTAFDGSGLVGAIFGRADVKGANFQRAVLSRADFSQVANLDQANFENACADTAPTFPAGFVCDLRKCNDPLKDKSPVCHFEDASAVRSNKAACQSSFHR